MSDTSKAAAEARAVVEHTNRELITFVLQRLAQIGPSREKSLAITKLHEALLWMGVPVGELP